MRDAIRMEADRTSTLSVRLSWVLRAAILVVPVVHVLLAPYTKVEESFNLHAAHDILKYGIFSESLPLEKYDHITFPGAIPRSFIPAIIWAYLSKPMILLYEWISGDYTGLSRQICLRIVLALCNSFSLLYISNWISVRTKSRNVSNPFLLLTVTQFHIMFYAGRCLPNFLALPFVNIAYGLLLSNQINQQSLALAILSAASSIIRSEIAAVLIPLAIYLLISRRLSLLRVISSGFVGGAGGAVLSTVVDSYFWRKWTWPELDAILFNVWEGKSAEWGVSPWYTYMWFHLPKLCLLSWPLLTTLLSDRRARRTLSGSKTMFCVAVAGSIGGLSFLGHKEWRFIIYTVPLVNTLGAVAGSSYLTNALSSKDLLERFTILFLIGMFMASTAYTAGSTYVSVNNYPGGAAIERLKSLGRNSTGPVRIFLPPSVLQTGASLFTFDKDVAPFSDWEFNRTESTHLRTPQQIWDAGFDYTINDEVELFLEDEGSDWSVIETVSSFGGIALKSTPRILWRPRLSILGRDNRQASEQAFV